MCCIKTSNEWPLLFFAFRLDFNDTALSSVSFEFFILSSFIFDVPPEDNKVCFDISFNTW